MKTITAKLRHLKIAPRKTRIVADLIRGLSVNEAQARLMLGARRPNVALLKLLSSAIANASANEKLKPESLYVKEIRVDQASKLVRYWPRARGAMGKIEKKASHVTLVLGEYEKTRISRFTVLPKPKKVKPEAADKKQKPKDQEKPQFSEKVSGPKIKEGGGFFRKVFRRKSI